jgi:hypothetical protein
MLLSTLIVAGGARKKVHRFAICEPMPRHPWSPEKHGPPFGNTLPTHSKAKIDFFLIKII